MVVSIQEQLAARFVKYCEIDSGSKENQNAVPSSIEQKQFLEVLADEARGMGYNPEFIPAGLRVHIAANVENVIPLLFGAHADTSPDAQNSNVHVMTHTYSGGDIQLPFDIIRASDYVELKKFKGETIFTSDGSTLLGGDDKSGVTALMTMLETFSGGKGKHGDIDVIFTYDEETGLSGSESLRPGVDTNARYGFLFDAEFANLGIDTFNAAVGLMPVTYSRTVDGMSRQVVVRIEGHQTFPGHGKKEGMIDPYRVLPRVYSILNEANLVVSDISGSCDGLELMVEAIFPSDLRLLGEILKKLAAVNDPRYPDKKPVSYEYASQKQGGIREVINFSKIVSMVAAIPDSMTAEQSDGFDGYIQPWKIVEIDGKKFIQVILRDFTMGGLEEKKNLMINNAPGIEIKDEYRNMRDQLLTDAPELIGIAGNIMRLACKCNITSPPTRGGDEAAIYTLQKMIPSVNLGALGWGCHSRREFLPLRVLESAYDTAIGLVEYFAQGKHRN